MQLIYSLIYMVIEFQIKETIEKFISFKYAGGFGLQRVYSQECCIGRSTQRM